MQVLIDTIDALSEPLHEVVQRPPGRAEADRADVRAVALYLFAQLYIRQAQRADAMDVWPSSSPQAAAAAAAAVRPALHGPNDRLVSASSAVRRSAPRSTSGKIWLNPGNADKSPPVAKGD